MHNSPDRDHFYRATLRYRRMCYGPVSACPSI